MNYRQFLRAATIIGAFSFSLFAHAAAFQFYELGAPVNGTAGVGQAAISNDASTSYYNPAGMMQLQDSQFLLGAQPILAYTNFSPSPANTIPGKKMSIRVITILFISFPSTPLLYTILERYILTYVF